MRRQLIKILYKGLSSLSKRVARLTNRSGEGRLESHELQENRNAVKMYAYFIHWFISVAEKEASSKAAIPTTKGKGKGKKKDNTSEDNCWVWDDLKEETLSSLLHILEVEKLSVLWGHSQPDEDFIHLFSKSAFQVGYYPLSCAYSI